MRAADDFEAIRVARRIIRGQINIAGPAGNPTQPTGGPTTNLNGDPIGECAECRTACTSCTGRCCC